MNKKKTYGQSLVEHIQKGYDLEDDVIEYRRVMEKDLVEKLHATATQAKSHTLYQNKDFYLVYLLKIERIGGVPRNYIFARVSCPTPTYRQSVWKYHHVSGHLEYLWTLPDKQLYADILRDYHRYLQDKECAQLAQFVCLDNSGQLLDWVKKENGEKIDGIITIAKGDECLVN